MTKQEIKDSLTMREVVERYGVSINRSGFAHCPFHKGDRTASLKVYSKSYHCFGCGADGDVFTWVMQMDHCDFMTALRSLGGENPTEVERHRAYMRKRQREAEARKVARRARYFQALRMLDKIIRMNVPPKCESDWRDFAEAVRRHQRIMYRVGLFDLESEK